MELRRISSKLSCCRGMGCGQPRRRGECAAARKSPFAVAVLAGDARVRRPAGRGAVPRRAVLARRKCRRRRCHIARGHGLRHLAVPRQCRPSLGASALSARCSDTAADRLLDTGCCQSVDWRAPATSESLIWTRSYFRAESEYLRAVPLWRNYRVQAVVLLVLTACVVVAFR